MVNTHQSIDTLIEIWEIVGDKEFSIRDLPAEFNRYVLRVLEKQGYLVKAGTVKIWYYDRYKEFPQYRIISRYLQQLKN